MTHALTEENASQVMMINITATASMDTQETIVKQVCGYVVHCQTGMWERCTFWLSLIEHLPDINF